MAHRPDEPHEAHEHRHALEHEVEADLHRLPLDSDVTAEPTRASLRDLLREHADLLPVIAVGGALGSLARWGLANAFPHRLSEVAWGTVVVNVAGSFLLGLLMAFVLDVWADRRYVRPFVGVGVLGGFTTFSTYELDARGLFATGHPVLALVYVGGSVVAALVAVTVGVVAGRAAIDARRTAGARS
ncbi:CrcB family protein [Nocardioides sp. CER19]|uniref:CrcB family protein n=1 Tax=Nocardioides sp. CER19 TaxID=3038538 RepID=UPI00244851C8|nr:CrcB family protein [Nocardioides sp. CER19]MDH2414568.1 CrcB family protein [Nocardioides sp. CER19]